MLSRSRYCTSTVWNTDEEMEWMWEQNHKSNTQDKPTSCLKGPASPNMNPPKKTPKYSKSKQHLTLYPMVDTWKKKTFTKNKNIYCWIDIGSSVSHCTHPRSTRLTNQFREALALACIISCTRTKAFSASTKPTAGFPWGRNLQMLVLSAVHAIIGFETCLVLLEKTEEMLRFFGYLH